MDQRNADAARFDPALYLKNNPDVADAGVDPVKHWMEFGQREEATGTRPHWRAPLFDDGFYRVAYPDADIAIAAGNFTSAGEHWFLAGREEFEAGKRELAVGFDEANYLAECPGVASEIAAGRYRSSYDHWLQRGRHDAGIRVAYSTLKERARHTPVLVTDERKRFFDDHGFMILPGLVSEDHCDRINGLVDKVWQAGANDRPPVDIDIFFRKPGGERIPFAAAPEEARAGTYKLNDLVTLKDDVQAVALDSRLTSVLRWVLGDLPVAIGSLNFERGSAQAFHTDTLYMPGPTLDSMTAAWIALEDVRPDAGPLTYYPGSHRIPLFTFSTGAANVIEEEMPAYRKHMQKHVDAMGLQPVTYLPKKGDVLIWHERLFHGGSPIADPSLTRKSLVVHYWRRSHVGAVAQAAGGHFLLR